MTTYEQIRAFFDTLKFTVDSASGNVYMRDVQGFTVGVKYTNRIEVVYLGTLQTFSPDSIEWQAFVDSFNGVPFVLQMDSTVSLQDTVQVSPQSTLVESIAQTITEPTVQTLAPVVPEIQEQVAAQVAVEQVQETMTQASAPALAVEQIQQLQQGETITTEELKNLQKTPAWVWVAGLIALLNIAG